MTLEELITELTEIAQTSGNWPVFYDYEASYQIVSQVELKHEGVVIS